MKNVIKAVVVFVVVASAAGCTSLSDFNAHSQALYQMNPAKYDSMSSSDKGNGYFQPVGSYNTQGD